MLVSRPDIWFVSMEFTLHGAVKLNRITGFSKAADNLLAIKNPSGCAVCLHSSLLLLPGHRNVINTNCGCRQRFQMVETKRQNCFHCPLCSLCFSYMMVMDLGGLLMCWSFVNVPGHY